MQTMEQEPKYPVGMQIFSEIREGNFVYVDKTRLIYKLTHRHEMVFLSRPRRFGKTLLVRTMQCYFEGRKELFKGLAMEHLETEWTKHPVLRFDLSNVKGYDMSGLMRCIDRQLKKYEAIYGANPKDVTFGNRFYELIHRACKQTGQKVVILIDEYDAPLLEVLSDSKKVDEVRNVMREFYAQIKCCDEYIRFAFLTGISTLSQVWLYCDLNNMINISDASDYSTICGITLQELKDNFQYGIRKFAKQENCSPEEMIDKLRDRYGGYHFTKSLQEVFCPYSLLGAFSDCDLNNYWFQTGTPSFFVSMLRARKGEWRLDEETVEGLETEFVSSFESPLERARGPLPFLYQTGYLTIKEYVKEYDMCILGVPNTEVRLGLTLNLIPMYSSMCRTLRMAENS